MAGDVSPPHGGDILKKEAVVPAENAVACGAVVDLTPSNFARILARIDNPTVVVSECGRFSKSHKYITSYNGLIFCTNAKESLLLPENVEVIRAKKISTPG